MRRRKRYRWQAATGGVASNYSCLLSLLSLNSWHPPRPLDFGAPLAPRLHSRIALHAAKVSFVIACRRASCDGWNIGSIQTAATLLQSVSRTYCIVPLALYTLFAVVTDQFSTSTKPQVRGQQPCLL